MTEAGLPTKRKLPGAGRMAALGSGCAAPMRLSKRLRFLTSKDTWGPHGRATKRQVETGAEMTETLKPKLND